MDHCSACGTGLIDGITRCPECGASLVKPGTLLQLSGWVLAVISLIPFSVGVIAAVQQNFIPLGVAFAFLVIGTGAVLAGKIKMAMSPNPTRPSSSPSVTTPPRLPLSST
jgi:hypothetical protein